MKFFDILFLKIRNQYVVWKEKEIPSIYGVALVSLLQGFNILSICYFLEEISVIKQIEHSALVYVFFTILSFNLLRYLTYRKADILEKLYGHLLKNKRMNIIILGYAISSVIALVVIITYHRVMVR